MRYEQVASGSEEKWKNISDFDGDYQISDQGRVRSIKYGNYRLRKPFICGKGYWAIDLCKNGAPSKYYIHRLVAQAFIKNPKNLPEVNHKDRNKTNNHRKNLNWCTGKGNMEDARKKGFNQDGENSHRAILTERDVIEIIYLYKTGEYTHAQIASKFNVSDSNVGAIINRIIWKHLKIA